MGDLKRRALTALALGPLFLALFAFLPPPWFLVFTAVVLVVCVYELASMARSAHLVIITILAASVIVPLYLSHLYLLVLWIVCSPAVLLLIRLGPGGKAGDTNRALATEIVVLLLSQVFLAFPLFSLFRLKEIGPYHPLILLLTMWASDTAAYLVGKSIGRHKLAPTVSPKKTMEGLLGAIAGALLITLVFSSALGLGVYEAIYVGCIIGFLGQMGDMLESVAKRVFEVKDSSALIPGHGGILDRIDSFLLTAPFMYYYLSGLMG